MSDARGFSYWRPALWFLATVVLAGGCDLSTKSWAQQTLEATPGHTTSVVAPWLEFSLAYNRGTAFSVIPSLGEARWLFALLALVITIVLAVAAVRRRPFEVRPILALGIIAGGALGNGYDRAFRLTPAGDTAVVDFIRVNITETFSWPTFNIADAWIMIGVVWLLWIGWRTAEPKEPAPAATG